MPQDAYPDDPQSRREVQVVHLTAKPQLEEQDDGPALVVQMRRSQEQPALLLRLWLTQARPYDRLEERRFEFVPLWGILVFLAYRMRRVELPSGAG